MTTFKLHNYDWHYMHYIEVTLSVTYTLQTPSYGLLHNLLHGSLHDKLHHHDHDCHYIIVIITTSTAWRVHSLLHLHYNFYCMTCLSIWPVTSLITWSITSQIKSSWLTLYHHVLHYMNYIEITYSVIHTLQMLLHGWLHCWLHG